jgi:diguanylate cyclase (GGDEF)-like protein
MIRGDYRVGASLAARAAEVAGRLGERRRQAAALVTLADQQRRLGEHEASVAAYEQAIQLLYAFGDDAGISKAMTSQSLPYTELGLYEEALRVLAASREIAQRIGDRDLLYWIYNRTGVLHTAMGEHIEADVFLRDALELADRMSPSDRCCIQNNIGNNAIGLVPLLRENGDATGAEDALEFALEHIKECLVMVRSLAHPYPYGTAISLDNYGMLLGLAGDFDAADDAVEQARVIALANGYRSLELNAALNAARVRILRGDLAEALDMLERLLERPELASDFGLLFAAHREASQVHQRLGNFEKALGHYQNFHRSEREANTQRAAIRSRLMINHFELDNAKLEAENARLAAELHRLRSQELEADKKVLELRASTLDRHAHEDALTGLWNRRYIETRLPLLHRAALDHDRPLCVCIVDVDHFKKINDTYGHSFGDEVLKTLANLLHEYSSEAGFVARLGGEEFLAVFPEMSLEQVRPICESMRVAIASRRWDFVDPDLRITASFGLTDNDNTADFHDLLARADERLYEAKRGGRNQVASTRDPRARR